MTRTCQSCRAELPADAPGHRCPRCLLELGLTREDEPPVESTLRADAPGGQTDQRIGRYKVLQQIGEGGCGIVYMAEQEEPVRRRVALKVIKLGMDTKSVIARFEAERQALAMMDHPNIARVFDGGATEQGRPFFVMELVRGIRITDYCDQQELSMRERLELFINVCQAVQHAHQKGIIHRDLKPSNILVTMNDGLAVAKVIDFGIAKAIEQRLTDKTLFTQFESFVGTPAYMSPEQAEMSSLDIDTRSDIYSLGVLLYEMLSGQTPFDARTLAQSGIDAMRRTICEVEPVRPSTRVRTLSAADLTTAAKRRGTDGPRLVKTLRRDLDWIVVKCLEKDRTRRYGTASSLAAELQRYISHEPIAARPPTTTYRLQKLVRRNPVTFTAAGAVAVALVVGLGATVWSLSKEREALSRAVAAEKTERKLRQRAEAGQTALLYWQAFDALAGLGDTDIKDIVADDQIDIEKSRALAARYDRVFELLRRAARIRSGCDWAANPADYPWTWVPSVSKVRHMLLAARLRARVALIRGHPQEASQDLVSTVVLARHVAVDAALVSVTLQMEVESAVVEFVAQNYFRFNSDSFGTLVRAIENAPVRVNVRRAVDEQAAFPNWLMGKIWEIRVATVGDEPKTLAKVGEFLAATMGWDYQETSEVIEAAGGTTTGILAYVREAIPFYEPIKNIATASPENVEAEANRLGTLIEGTSNLIVRRVLPNLRKGRTREIESLTRLAMLRAAAAYKEGGVAGLSSVRDPFGDGPFELRLVEGGFELRSKIERLKLKGTLLFMEKSSPPSQARL